MALLVAGVPTYGVLPTEARPGQKPIRELSASSATRLQPIPKNPQNVYLAASDGGGLFTSTDGGHTWANTHANNGCSAIAVDPITPEHLLASCDDDKDILQFSNDRGQTWNGLPLTIGSSTLEYIFLITFDSNKQGTIYLGIFSRQRIRHCEIDRWWVFVGRYRQRASGPRSRRAFSRRSAIVRNFANGF